MTRHRGFTVIELLVAVAFLAAASLVALSQLQAINTKTLNDKKRTAINAMYFSLEEDFYKRHGYYPEQLREGVLPTMDQALLKDPAGHPIGETASAYRYEATDCRDGRCRSYTLRATLAGEDDFVKTNRQR